MKITTSTIKEIVRLYTTTDLTTYDIARKFNISAESVRLHLIDAGVKLNRGKRNNYKKYYKDKYMIALYDMNDHLYRVFDNGYRLAEFLNISNNAVYRMLNSAFINTKLRHKGNWYRKVLIEVN